MAGEVTVLNHQHPGCAVADQTEPEGLPERVLGPHQITVSLALQQITQGVPWSPPVPEQAALACRASMEP